eukprot:TRINITY_DN27381_c0_g1_i3.p1 TRINITY_DN27381_c0_g1~~TRINITY_DN27381_c0_g1_i3.p1  ORF type:complete len:818 (+),score=108.44 TRINITY_DN27381_c0_g1_i3:214-2667(+)
MFVGWPLLLAAVLMVNLEQASCVFVDMQQDAIVTQKDESPEDVTIDLPGDRQRKRFSRTIAEQNPRRQRTFSSAPLAFVNESSDRGKTQLVNLSDNSNSEIGTSSNIRSNRWQSKEDAKTHSHGPTSEDNTDYYDGHSLYEHVPSLGAFDSHLHSTNSDRHGSKGDAKKAHEHDHDDHEMDDAKQRNRRVNHDSEGKDENRRAHESESNDLGKKKDGEARNGVGRQHQRKAEIKMGGDGQTDEANSSYHEPQGDVEKAYKEDRDEKHKRVVSERRQTFSVDKGVGAVRNENVYINDHSDRGGVIHMEKARDRFRRGRDSEGDSGGLRDRSPPNDRARQDRDKRGDLDLQKKLNRRDSHCRGKRSHSTGINEEQSRASILEGDGYEEDTPWVSDSPRDSRRGLNSSLASNAGEAADELRRRGTRGVVARATPHRSVIKPVAGVPLMSPRSETQTTTTTAPTTTTTATKIATTTCGGATPSPCRPLHHEDCHHEEKRWERGQHRPRRFEMLYDRETHVFHKEHRNDHPKLEDDHDGSHEAHGHEEHARGCQERERHDCDHHGEHDEKSWHGYESAHGHGFGHNEQNGGHNEHEQGHHDNRYEMLYHREIHVLHKEHRDDQHELEDDPDVHHEAHGHEEHARGCQERERHDCDHHGDHDEKSWHGCECGHGQRFGHNEQKGGHHEQEHGHHDHRYEMPCHRENHMLHKEHRDDHHGLENDHDGHHEAHGREEHGHGCQDREHHDGDHHGDHDEKGWHAGRPSSEGGHNHGCTSGHGNGFGHKEHKARHHEHAPGHHRDVPHSHHAHKGKGKGCSRKAARD